MAFSNYDIRTSVDELFSRLSVPEFKNVNFLLSDKTPEYWKAYRAAETPEKRVRRLETQSRYNKKYKRSVDRTSKERQRRYRERRRK